MQLRVMFVQATRKFLALEWKNLTRMNHKGVGEKEARSSQL